MALDPLTAGISLVETAISRIWPDKSAAEQMQIAAAVQAVQAQMDVNKVEAAHPSVFVSGWRPAIGWICGAAFAWNWVGLPIAKMGLAIAGVSLDLSPASMAEMMPVLLGMLGLSGLRSFEKSQRVAAK